LARNLREVDLDIHHPVIQTFGRLWEEIQDLPRHLGQHSGGMVMCHGRLDDVVPLENASMPNRVVVQWDKDDCADMRIVKVDLLGLGMMDVLQDSLTLLNGDGALSNAKHAKPAKHSDEDLAFADSAAIAFPRRDLVDLAHLPQDPAVYR